MLGGVLPCAFGYWINWMKLQKIYLFIFYGKQIWIVVLLERGLGLIDVKQKLLKKCFPILSFP
jgi:hypothetical protein